MLLLTARDIAKPSKFSRYVEGFQGLSVRFGDLKAIRKLGCGMLKGPFFYCRPSNLLCLYVRSYKKVWYGR